MLEPPIAVDSTSFDDNEYKNMTLEEKRKWNTARNQDLINILFPEGNLLKKKDDDITESPAVLPADDAEVEEEPSVILESIKNQIPNRVTETGRILDFLSKSLFPAQPLLVYGPTGSGKTYLCELCLAEIVSSPIVSINCKDYTHLKKLLGDVWRFSVEAVSAFNKKYFNRTVASEHLLSSLKYPTTFDDLTDRLASLLECQNTLFSRYAPSDTPLTRGVVLFFDNIDRADDVDPGLASRLLSLKDLSHDMLKVVATRRSPPRSNAQCILVCLRAYSDDQLLNIMERLYDMQQEDGGDGGGSSTAIQEEEGEDSEAVAFSKLCSQSLPFVTLKTRHVDEVWAVITSVWGRQLRRSKKDRVILERRKLDKSASTDSVGGGGGYGGAKKLKRTTEDDVNVVLLQPVPHCSTMYDRSIAPSTAVKDGSTSGAAAMSLLDISLPITTATLLGKGWCVDLSVMARILLLAAYLASRNSQDTDRTTFGNALKGRRKKARMGSEETSSSNQDIYDRHSVPRAFGLERLMAIYIQILPAAGIARRLIHGNQEVSGTSAGVDKDLTDNESLIYATINNLVRRRLLLARYPSSVAKSAYIESSAPVMYLCTVDTEAAEMLARSSSFPLRDFLST